MKILKIIGIILLVIIVGCLGMAIMQSDHGSINSSISINASPESVYEECVNIKKMDAWSPWHAIEPSAFSYEGPEEGVGATSKWNSENPELGIGSLKIIEVTPNEYLKSDMKFEGFDGTFNSWVKIEEEGEGSKVTWGYDYSDIGLMGRFFMSLMDVNEEMLPKFDQGLADLKKIVESKPTPEPEVMEEGMASDSTAMETPMESE